MASTLKDSIASTEEKIIKLRQELQTLLSHERIERTKQRKAEVAIVNRYTYVKNRLALKVADVTSSSTTSNNSFHGIVGVPSASLRQYSEALNHCGMKNSPYVINLESRLAQCLHRMGNLHVQNTLASRHYSSLIKREESAVDEQHIHSCAFEKHCLRQIITTQSTIALLKELQREALQEAKELQKLLSQRLDLQQQQGTKFR